MIREVLVQAAQEDIGWAGAFTIVGIFASVAAIIIVAIIRGT